MSGGRRSFPLLTIAFASMFLACGDRGGTPQADTVQSGAPPAASQDTSPAGSDTAVAGSTDTGSSAARDSAPRSTPAAAPAEGAPAKKPAPAPRPAARAPKPAAPAPTPPDTPPQTAAARTPTADNTAAAAPAADTAPATPTPAAPAQTADAAQGNAPLRDEYHRAPLDTVSQQVYDGWKQYNLNCARCHGEDVLGSTIAPHLVTSLKPNGPINTKELFVQTVCAGRPEKGMPAWCPLGLEMDKIEAMYAYVKGRSDGKLRPGRPALKQDS